MANLKLVKSATALVLGASVLTSAVAVSGTDASAKTTYKVTKAGTLVNAKTNKAVKGYKSYKGKLYKNGKKLTGTYKSVFYKSGVKFTGTYNKKYYVKGKLFTGKTSKNVYYKKGVKFTGVTSYGYTYKDGKRVEGEYKGKVYKNGKLLTGLYKDVLYKKGVKETGLDLYKDKLYNEGVLNVGLALFQEKLYNNADLATGIFTYNGVEDQYKDGVVVPTKVESASAVNSTTIEVKGTNLTKLTQADYTVSNNTIKSVSVSADRTTATIVVDKALLDGETVTLTAKDQKIDFSYKLDFKTVSVLDAKYDDDTAKQFIKLTVDGKAMTAADLIAAGYTVKFAAYADAKGTTPAVTTGTTSILADDSTGELRDDLDSYATTTDGKKAYITVTATKGSQVITSELQPVLIQNIELAADSISAVELKNTKATAFVQNSKTLVVGDTANISAITVKAGSDEEDVTSNYTVKSSNTAVLSADALGNLTAKAPGTATLTISYGKTSTTVTITVKNEARELSKVTVVNSKGEAVSSKALANGANGATTAPTPVYVLAVDQYGDPVLGATNLKAFSVGDILSSPASTGTALTASATATLAAKGFYDLTLTPAAGKTGNTSVSFKQTASDTRDYLVSSNTFKVSVSANDTIAKHELEYAGGESTDLTLNNQDSSDDAVDLKLNPYTSEGAKLASADLSAATTSIEVVQSSPLITATLNADNQTINVATVAGSTKTGTATVKVVYNGVTYQKTITVESKVPTVTAAAFKGLVSPTYAVKFNHENAFTLSGSTTNPVVSGLTLNVGTAQPVRLDVATGKLYIDKDADAIYNNDDVEVGSVVIEYTSANDVPATATGTQTISANLNNGITFKSGDKGTLTYKVLAKNGTVASWTSVEINL